MKNCWSIASRPFRTMFDLPCKHKISCIPDLARSFSHAQFNTMGKFHWNSSFHCAVVYDIIRNRENACLFNIYDMYSTSYKHIIKIEFFHTPVEHFFKIRNILLFSNNNIHWFSYFKWNSCLRSRLCTEIRSCNQQLPIF